MYVHIAATRVRRHFRVCQHITCLDLQCHLQVVGGFLPPAPRAQARAVCRAWKDALTHAFTELFIGPTCPSSAHHVEDDDEQNIGGHTMPLPSRPLGDVFPSVDTVTLVTSSSREYHDSYAEV